MQIIDGFFRSGSIDAQIEVIIEFVRTIIKKIEQQLLNEQFKMKFEITIQNTSTRIYQAEGYFRSEIICRES
ncbi:unnamed protein product [Paramecium sonneborni]|uniref:Uncharacterized protein n=1 Tax=Paramecium sonneborni TaxID=65129 RepID=A0A8S1RKM4_9CILI|nr:unnamed protein product [Paramecium sonneborni]CAD8127835.1 unnamed protein product [Paramecium sonneborni]